MKKIVFINQSTGYLMIDIINEYAKSYDKVALIAGSVKTMERPLHEKVRVIKIAGYKRISINGRIWSWLWGSFQVLFLLVFRFRKYELVYVTNPPFAYLSSVFLRNIFSVIVYDTYPDALKNIGISERNILYKLWSEMNKKLFERAKNIFTLSESMAEQLSEYVNRDKVKVIPNWSGSVKFKPLAKANNLFLSQHSLNEKFIVLYSGNMGYTHNVEVLFEAARILAYNMQITFVFVGEGSKKAELIKQMTDSELKNCVFLTWQTAEMLPFSLASADLGVVTLNDTTGMLSVPSKTYNLMAAGVPLLSIAPENSELAVLINKYGNGRNFSTSQAKEIADFIVSCSKNNEMLKKMSECSLKASHNFTYVNAKLYLIN